MTTKKELKAQIDELETRVAELESVIRAIRHVFEPTAMKATEVDNTIYKPVEPDWFNRDHPTWRAFDPGTGKFLDEE